MQWLKQRCVCSKRTIPVNVCIPAYLVSFPVFPNNMHQRVKVNFFYEDKTCLARGSSVKHCKTHDSFAFFHFICHLMSDDPTLQLSY